MGNATSSKQVPSLKEQNSIESKSQLFYIQETICKNEQPFRIEGDQLKDILHRSVVALTSLNRHKRMNAGSGVLISKDCILTAAHNIFDKHLNAENSNFKVYIGANGIGEKYYQVESWRYPEEFKTCPPSLKLTYDYAIMKLKIPVKFSRFMPLSFACQECLMKNNDQIKLKIYGFPCTYHSDNFGDKRSFKDNFKQLDKQGSKLKLYQYGLSSTGRIVVVDALQHKIGYGISTLPGQSGCPVAVNSQIIAIHVGGDKQQFNVGRIIDFSLFGNLVKWILQLNVTQFKLKCQNQFSQQIKSSNYILGKYKFIIQRFGQY